MEEEDRGDGVVLVLVPGGNCGKEVESARRRRSWTEVASASRSSLEAGRRRSCLLRPGTVGLVEGWSGVPWL